VGGRRNRANLRQLGNAEQGDYAVLVRTVLIIAATVLLTAGTTQAVNRLVTSRDIKNGTIQPVDLSAKAKRTMKGARGAEGPPGPPGAQGLRGPQGERGLLSSTTWVTGSIGTAYPGSFGYASATCPSGTKVVSGGFNTTSTTLAAKSERAVGPTIWAVEMVNFGPTYPASFTAYALCAS
jgi:hypothetical protein